MDKGQTGMPCRESLGMENLFSGYWEGRRIGEVWGERKKWGERQKAASSEQWAERERGENGDQLASAGRRRLGVGGACLLKGQSTQEIRQACIKIITFPSFSYHKKSRS